MTRRFIITYEGLAERVNYEPWVTPDPYWSGTYVLPNGRYVKQFTAECMRRTYASLIYRELERQEAKE